jgi:hypothetical protein
VTVALEVQLDITALIELHPRALVLLTNVACLLEEEARVCARIDYQRIKEDKDKLKAAIGLRDYAAASKLAFATYLKLKEPAYSLSQLFLAHLA